MNKASEFFVIRTRDRQYVGPLGFTPMIEKAVYFPSRMAALGKCNELGAVLEGAAIVPYRPPSAPEGTRTGPRSRNGSGRARTPWKAGNG